MTAPRLGLLLDVDGPIASPVTRTIAIPSIVADLVALAAQGVPIVFNTGRSDAFIREQVVGPLIAGGLAEGGRVHAVCEKGAVWCSIGPQYEGGMSDLVIAEDLALPRDFADEMRDLDGEDTAVSQQGPQSRREVVQVGDVGEHVVRHDQVGRSVASDHVGGKLLGAGGSGFMCFFVPPARQASVLRALGSYLHVPFAFEDEGSRVIHYGVQASDLTASAAASARRELAAREARAPRPQRASSPSSTRNVGKTA